MEFLMAFLDSFGWYYKVGPWGQSNGPKLSIGAPGGGGGAGAEAARSYAHLRGETEVVQHAGAAAAAKQRAKRAYTELNCNLRVLKLYVCGAL